MSKASAAMIEAVFEKWKERQERPGLCRNSESRRKLIKAALQDMSVVDLLTLFEFAYEADHRQAAWWRGENPQSRKYLRLEDLLRPTKLAPRVELALRWKAGALDDADETWDSGDDDDDGGDADGPLGQVRRQQRRSTGRSLRRTPRE